MNVVTKKRKKISTFFHSFSQIIRKKKDFFLFYVKNSLSNQKLNINFKGECFFLKQLNIFLSLAVILLIGHKTVFF